jgi:hypothetical protein
MDNRSTYADANKNFVLEAHPNARVDGSQAYTSTQQRYFTIRSDDRRYGNALSGYHHSEAAAWKRAASNIRRQSRGVDKVNTDVR